MLFTRVFVATVSIDGSHFVIAWVTTTGSLGKSPNTTGSPQNCYTLFGINQQAANKLPNILNKIQTVFLTIYVLVLCCF